jgi:hypothetical protein
MKLADWRDVYRASGYSRRDAAKAAIRQVAAGMALDQADLTGEDPVEVIAAWAFANLAPGDLLRLSSLLGAASDENGRARQLADIMHQHGGRFPKQGPDKRDVLAGDAAIAKSFEETYPQAARIGVDLSHRPPSSLAELTPAVAVASEGFAMDTGGGAEDDFYALFPEAKRLGSAS